MITSDQFFSIDTNTTKQPQHQFQSHIKVTNTSQSFFGNFCINFVQFCAILHVMDVIFAYFNGSSCVFVDIRSKNIVYLEKLKDWMQLLIMLLKRNGHSQPNNTILIIRCKNFRTITHRFLLTVNIRTGHSITETRIRSKNKQYLMACYCAKIRNNDRKTSFIKEIFVDCNMCEILGNQTQTANRSSINHRILVLTTIEMSNNITGLILQVILSITTSASATMNETSVPASTLKRDELEPRKIGLANTIVIAD